MSSKKFLDEKGLNTLVTNIKRELDKKIDAENLPQDIVSSLSISASGDNIAIDVDKYHNSGTEDGYQPNPTIITLSAATESFAGLMTAEDKKIINKAVQLDDAGHINSDQLPSYIDDVLEFTGIVKNVTVTSSITSGYTRIGVVYDSAAQVFYGQFRDSNSGSFLTPKYSAFTFPPDTSKDDIAGINAPIGGSPERGKIYVNITDNKSYRWSGSQLIEITSGGISLGETSDTAYAGDKGAQNASAIASIQKMLEGDKPVVVPRIYPLTDRDGQLWSIVDKDGTKVSTSSSLNLTTIYGYDVSFSGRFIWVSNESYKNPTAIAGGDWSVFPSSGQYSETLSVDNIEEDRTFSVKLSAPTNSLVVENNRIRLPKSSDLDFSSASVKVHFQYKTVLANVTYSSVTAETLQGLLSSSNTYSLQDNKTKTASATTAENEYLMYAYPVKLGELSKITMNDATPLLQDGFIKSTVSVKDPETKATVNYLVYTSVKKGAFTNTELEIV